MMMKMKRPTVQSKRRHVSTGDDIVNQDISIDAIAENNHANSLSRKKFVSPTSIIDPELYSSIQKVLSECDDFDDIWDEDEGNFSIQDMMAINTFEF
jgi:hypothetical protein